MGSGDGADVQLGQANNFATQSTEISTSFGDGLYGISSRGNGLHGSTTDAAFAGVEGDDLSGSVDGYGIYGYSQNGTGVYSRSVKPSGVPGAPSAAGVIGDSNTNDGVAGLSSATNGVAGFTTASGQSGVFGSDLSDSGSSNGVFGVSNDWIGVSGQCSGLSNIARRAAGVLGDSSFGAGVIGQSSASDGVIGITKADYAIGVAAFDHSSAGGMGVLAESNEGIALWVNGKASFTRSGVASVTTNETSVAVTVPGGLTSSSYALAVLQTDSGTISVRSAVPNPSTGNVTINLSGEAPAGTTVAWLVIN
jgi:hypothetical protein